MRSQELTGTDNVYIAKQGFWASFGFLMSSFFSFLAILAFANLLPKEVYGTYKYLISLAGSLTFLFLNGINTAVARTVARGHRGALAYAVRLQLRWNLIYVAVAGGFALYYYINGNIVFAAGLAILAFVTPLSSILNTSGPYLTATKQFRTQSLFVVASGIWYGLVMVIALLLTDNVIALIGTYAVATLVPASLVYIHTQRSAGTPNLPEEERRPLVNLTTHLSVVNIITTIGLYIDKVLMFQFVGPTALATYSFALLGPDRIRGLLKSVNGIIFPKVATRTLEEINRVFYIRILQGAGVGALACAGYILLAHPVFSLFFPQYLTAVPYSQVLSLTLIAVVPNVYMGHVVNSHRLLRIIYFGGPFVQGTKIALFVGLGYWFGAWGIITAAVVAQAFNVLWNASLWYWFVRRPNGAYAIQ